MKNSFAIDFWGCIIMSELTVGWTSGLFLIGSLVSLLLDFKTRKTDENNN
jgi:hypothetical protein